MFDSATGTVGVLIGILAVAALIIPLGAGSVSGYLLLPWVVALVAFSTPFLLQLTPVAVLSQAWVRKHYADVAAVIALLAFFIALNTYDLTDWYYSAIGDEYLFLEHAKHMAEQGITHPFSQEGVYNHHPVMSSVYQAMVMWIFGADYYGWTLSSLLSAALTIPGIYLLGNNLGGRKTALFATVLFAVSHYIWAGTHIGNTVLTPMPVSVWSIALLVSGWRNGNPLLLYAAGGNCRAGFLHALLSTGDSASDDAVCSNIGQPTPFARSVAAALGVCVNRCTHLCRRAGTGICPDVRAGRRRVLRCGVRVRVGPHLEQHTDKPACIQL